MKKIALFLMAAFAVVACQEEFVPHVDFTPAEVTIPTAGTENLETPLTFTFNANAAWTAQLTGEGVAEWLSISPKSGEAGDASIKFDAIANTGKENRKATLEISVEGLEPILVNVVQLQKNAIDVNADATYTLSFKGETLEIEVGHNVDYTYEVVYADGVEPWLVETKAYAIDKLVFTAPAQEVNGAERKATLYVYSELGLVETIVIAQEQWSAITWTQSLSAMGATAGRAGIAVLGDKVYFTANGELWTVDEATGENAQKVALPAGFVAGGVHVDDAGNLLVSTPDALWDSDKDRVADGTLIELYKVNQDGTYQSLVSYNSANYYSTEMGNFRVKGDVTKNAVITAYICDGGGHAIIWEVTDGAVADPKYVDLKEGSWDASTGVVAPAGPTLADGLFAISYGAIYNLFYYDGTEWTESYVTNTDWDDNHNCISTAEVNGKKYLGLLTGSFAANNYSKVTILNIDDPKAAKMLYHTQMTPHTLNADAFYYCDIFVKAENGKLAAYAVDPFMDSVEKYLFPLQ
ncbi:MAG: hypothetical protein J5990_10560 [Bacteroidales bacterium]|nr:hypothetical protein [Bacteroidales bacterium]